MESRNNSEVFLEQGSSNLKKSKEDLVKNLNVSKSSIPDWKNFDVRDIADIRIWSEKKIVLKCEKEDGKRRKFIEINWRKYYEFNWKGTPAESFYIYRGWSLFLWDKLWWLAIWEWVSFRCLPDSMDSFIFEQRWTRYSWWAMHLQQLYKSENFPSWDSITTVSKRWKRVKITKNLIEKYLDWSIGDSSRVIIENAMKLDPEFFEYVESLNK